jgi:hypothetical protein
MKSLVVFCISVVVLSTGLSAHPAAENYLNAGDSTELPSADYKVKVNGTEMFVYKARVSAMPVNVWPGVKRPLQQTEIAAFCSFTSQSGNSITVVSSAKIENVIIRPLSLGIHPVIKGNEISFEISRPCQLVVEVNGWHKALHLFINPVISSAKEKNNSDDLYFGPGLHFPGIILAKSNQHIVLDSGAVVFGSIYGRDLHDLTISGTGILDGSRLVRNVDTVNLVELINCKNVQVSGIVMRDAPIWTLMTYECRDILINNIKIVGMWRYNSDGIDLSNSKSIIVENSFVRAFDDCLVIKGFHRTANPETPVWNISDIVFRNCVVWNDWGRALEIGAETVADSISHIVYSSIDIIHFVHIALDIQNGNRAIVSDVLYDDIRIEDPITENAYLDDLKDPILDISEVKNNPRNTKKFVQDDLGRLFVIEIQDNGWVKDKSLGSVFDITYRNINYQSAWKPKSFFTGFSSDHAVRNIRFENIRIRGLKLTDGREAGFKTNEFVKDLIIQ